MRGRKGNERKVICPECQGALLIRAKTGDGRNDPDNRLYRCPQCGEVFWGHEIAMNWRSNQRPDVEIVQ